MSQWVNGQWEAGQGEHFGSCNPVSGAPVWEGAAASDSQIDRAVAAARRAFPGWRDQAIDARLDIVRRFAGLLQQHSASLADCIGLETGKPRWEAATEVQNMVAKIELSWQAWQERTGSRSAPQGDGRTVLQHRPHGVLAVYGPFNFPGHLPNGHIVPALLAGNCVVFKPSELAPATAERCARLWQEAGLPPGVLNLLQGGAATGAGLSRHPGLDGLLFTGSAATGIRLHQQFAGQPQKMLALETGGNNPLIVAEVADPRAAVHHIIMSAFLTAGQRCTCARRLLLPAGPWGDSLLEALLAAAAALVPAEWNAEPQPFLGSVISTAAAARLLQAQQHLQAMGATPLLPMRAADRAPALLSPGLLDVTAVATLPDEEYFGPLLQVQRYADFGEALALANATRFGLSAGLLADDSGLFARFYREIRAGIVNWNRPLTGASSASPFGGVGQSGNHRPGAWYAADYCAHPVAGLEADRLQWPATLAPGLAESLTTGQP